MSYQIKDAVRYLRMLLALGFSHFYCSTVLTQVDFERSPINYLDVAGTSDADARCTHGQSQRWETEYAPGGRGSFLLSQRFSFF